MTAASEIADAPAARAGWSATLTDRAVLGAMSALFAAPNLVLAARLRPLPGTILGVATAAAFVVLLDRARGAGPLDAALKPGRLLACLGLAAAILILGGETHLVFANPDWLIRDAVLSDLSRAGFPVGYETAIEPYMLRAPLGMYLVPALAGRAGGLAAAHAALLGQNTVLLGGVLYLLASLGRGLPHVGLLVLFGGLGILWRGIEAIVAGDASTLLRYARPLDEWNASFQYSSSITQFFWVPNHALPGWWLAALLILAARGGVDVATIGVSVALMMLWSPLAILPAVPMLIWLAAREPRRVLAAARTWAGLAVAAGFVPVAIYLTAASGTIDHGLAGGKEHFAPRYIAFVLIQLAAVGFLAAHRRRLDQNLRGLVGISVIVLLALPFVSFGPSNDLVMRGSIAALVILAFAFGDVVVDLAGTSPRRAVPGLVLALVGAAPAAIEVARALLTPSFAISGCTLLQASRETGDAGVPANYVAPADRVPAWLVEPVPASRRLAAQPGRCWPDLTPPGGAR